MGVRGDEKSRDARIRKEADGCVETGSRWAREETKRGGWIRCGKEVDRRAAHKERQIGETSKTRDDKRCGGRGHVLEARGDVRTITSKHVHHSQPTTTITRHTTMPKFLQRWAPVASWPRHEHITFEQARDALGSPGFQHPFAEWRARQRSTAAGKVSRQAVIHAVENDDGTLEYAHVYAPAMWTAVSSIARLVLMVYRPAPIRSPARPALRPSTQQGAVYRCHDGRDC